MSQSDPSRLFDTLLTTREAAAFLRIVPGTIHQWVHQGRLKPLRLNGYVLRFRLSDLEALLDTNNARGKAPRKQRSSSHVP